MSSRSKKGIVAALIAWCLLLGIAALTYRFVLSPLLKKSQGDEAEEALIASTSASGNYARTVTLQLDGFSGYAVLRSPEFKQQLKQAGIRLELVDDNADYGARIQALEKGSTQMAVFPLNSFVQAGERLGEYPATIVLVIDETQGADAIVAYKDAVKTIQDLDDPQAKIVYTADSPSEFLAEITVESFILPKLNPQWRTQENGSERILRKMLRADPQQKAAYVLWEPELSQALEQPGIHVLLDSSKTKGYILDALVVERGFLQAEPDAVKAILRAYLRTVYSYSAQDALHALVEQDASMPGKSLAAAHAENITRGIQWKNTTDNLNYFGLKDLQVETIEDILSKIVNVMQQTQLLASDPLAGNYTTIYYDQPLRDLQAEGFHPGKKLDVIAGGLNLNDEQASGALELHTLSDAQWRKLTPVGHFQVDQIRFPRMSDKITLQNQRRLIALAQRLKNWPSYYVTIIGQSQQTDDPELNKIALNLAQRRADASAAALQQSGIHPLRLRSQARLSQADDWSALNLVFEAGQLPY